MAPRFVSLAIYSCNSQEEFTRFATMGSSNRRGEPARDIFNYVGVENLIQAMTNWAGSGDRVSRNFSDADQIAVRRGYKNLFGRVKVLGPQQFLGNRKPRFRRNFEQDAARHSFEAARTERRRKNLSVLQG